MTARAAGDRTLTVVTGLACALLPLLLLVTRDRPLWLDEAASATMAELPAASLRRVLLDREGNGLLHTLLLRAWRELAPGDEGLRALSVLAAVAGVVLATLLARQLLDRRAVLLVPPLLVANPLLVRYAAEARSYALLLALAAASGLLLVRAVRTPTAGRWLAYALVAGLAVYAQYFALLMVAGQLLALLLLRRAGLRPRHLAPAAVLLLALLAPLPRLMTDDAAGGVGYLAGSPLSTLLPLGVLVAAGGTAVVLAVRWRHARPSLRVGQDRWPLVLLVSWLVTPVVLAVLLSVLQRPVLAPRYFMVCLPPAVLLLAWALSRLPLRAGVPATVLVCLAGTAIGGVWIDRHTEAWDEVGRYVAATAGPGDEVLFVEPYVRIPYERHHSAEGTTPAYPELPWGGDLAPLFFFTPLPEPAVAAAVRGAPQVHVVVSHVGLYDDDDPAYSEVAAALTRAGFRQADERAFQGVVVERWRAVDR